MNENSILDSNKDIASSYENKTIIVADLVKLGIGDDKARFTIIDLETEQILYQWRREALKYSKYGSAHVLCDWEVNSIDANLDAEIEVSVKRPMRDDIEELINLLLKDVDKSSY